MRVNGMLAATLVAVVCSACGGGGGGGQTPAQNARVGGLWEGTVEFTDGSTQDLLGIVAEDGRAYLLQVEGDAGVLLWGTVRSSANRVTASVTGATVIGITGGPIVFGFFEDGSSSGTGSVEGSIRERSSVTADVVFTTSAGTRTTSRIELRYDDLYERDSSLGAIAGNYTSAVFPGEDALNIANDGVLFGQNPGTGCVVNGRVSVVDSRYNAYEFEYSYGSCTGELAVRNGVTYRGIGFLEDSMVPAGIAAFLQGTLQGGPVGEVLLYERT